MNLFCFAFVCVKHTKHKQQIANLRNKNITKNHRRKKKKNFFKPATTISLGYFFTMSAMHCNSCLLNTAPVGL